MTSPFAAAEPEEGPRKPRLHSGGAGGISDGCSNAHTDDAAMAARRVSGTPFQAAQQQRQVAPSSGYAHIGRSSPPRPCLGRPSLSSQASAEALARYSNVRQESVRSALDVISRYERSYAALRDRVGVAFVDSRDLTKVGHLGVGAYSTVEHCRLVNWRDDSQHGAATVAAAALAASSAAAIIGAAAAAAQDAAGYNRADNAAAASELASRRHLLRQRAALDVAVKYLREELFSRPGDLEDFVKEAVLLAGLQHRSIVGVLGLGFTATEASGSGVERASMFMVTELCTGGTLREMVLAQMMAGRKVVYSYAQGLQWCAQVADGLAFLHEQQPKIIHRDVKLDNVLLAKGDDGTWEAKLADFGLHATVKAMDRTKRQIFVEAKSANSNSDPGCTEYGDSVIEFQGGKDGASVKRHGSSDGKSVSISWQSSGSTDLLYRTSSADKAFRKVRSLVRVRSSSGSGVRDGAAASAITPVARQRLTGQTGSFLGMAPEVTLGNDYDEKADIFSLGCVLLDVMGKQLTSSEVAYHGTAAEFQMYARRVACGYRRPHPQNWPPQLSALVASCLAHQAHDRPTAAQAAERLCELAKDVAALDSRRRGTGCSCLG